MTNQSIKVVERPSTLIENKLNKLERDVIDYLCKNLEITPEEADNLLHSNQIRWDRLVSDKKKQYTLEMFDLISLFKDAVKKKVEVGSLEQAKAGMTGIAIGGDKVFTESRSPTFSIGGKNVQINLGFKYQPLKKGITSKKQ